mgnify:CR=1 FL=1
MLSMSSEMRPSMVPAAMMRHCREAREVGREVQGAVRVLQRRPVNQVVRGRVADDSADPHGLQRGPQQRPLERGEPVQVLGPPHPLARLGGAAGRTPPLA